MNEDDEHAALQHEEELEQQAKKEQNMKTYWYQFGEIEIMEGKFWTELDAYRIEEFILDRLKEYCLALDELPKSLRCSYKVWDTDPRTEPAPLPIFIGKVRHKLVSEYSHEGGTIADVVEFIAQSKAEVDKPVACIEDAYKKVRNEHAINFWTKLLKELNFNEEGELENDHACN